MTITPAANIAASPFQNVYAFRDDKEFTSTGTSYGQAHKYGSMEKAVKAAEAAGFKVLILTEVKGGQVEGDVTTVGTVAVVMSAGLKEIRANEYASEKNSMNCIVEAVSGEWFGVRETKEQIGEMIGLGNLQESQSARSGYKYNEPNR